MNCENIWNSLAIRGHLFGFILNWTFLLSAVKLKNDDKNRTRVTRKKPKGIWFNFCSIHLPYILYGIYSIYIYVFYLGTAYCERKNASEIGPSNLHMVLASAARDLAWSVAHSGFSMVPSCIDFLCTFESPLLPLWLVRDFHFSKAAANVKKNMNKNKPKKLRTRDLRPKKLPFFGSGQLSKLKSMTFCLCRCLSCCLSRCRCQKGLVSVAWNKIYMH